MLRKMRTILATLLPCMALMICFFPVHADLPAPCEYFGKLTILGEPAPPGTVVVGMISGKERGRIVTQEGGQYGSTCMFGKKLHVQAAEGEYTQGKILRVDFYVNGMKADQTATYSPGVKKWRDLTVSSVPTPEPTPTVEPPPEVMFNASPVSGYAPLMVTFTDQTPANVSSWSWDFGDGNLSTDRQPSHLYRFPGNFSVNLTIHTSKCQSSLLVADYITVVQAPLSPFPNQTAPPTDPDSDGFYEDLNGNDRLEFEDLFIFFTFMDWMTDHPPFNHFDYNMNGRIDFEDLYSLFMEI